MERGRMSDQQDLEQHVNGIAHEMVQWLSKEELSDHERQRVSQLVGMLSSVPHNVITLCQVAVDSQSQTSHLMTSLIQLAKICREQEQVPEGMFPKLVETLVLKGLAGYDERLVDAMIAKTRPIGEMLLEKRAPGTSLLVDANGKQIRG